MNRYTFDNDGFTFVRIPKNKARSAYNNGLTVVFCPVNLRPFTMWHPETDVNKNRFDGIDPENTFEHYVNTFECYNCTNAETGKYAAFYIPVKYEATGFFEDPKYTYDYSYMQ